MIINGNDSRAIEASRGIRTRSRRRSRPIAEVLEGRQLLATITVNTTGDGDGADGSGTISLRQAIEISNGTLAVSSLTESQMTLVSGPLSTPNTIDFDIPGTGPFVISPTSALPAITSAVVIDGYSQPGSHPNTNGPGLGKNMVLQIELDGSQVAPGASGLDLKAVGNTIRGLAIGGFEKVPTSDSFLQTGGAGIFVDGSGNNLIEGNFIGTDVTGTKALPNGDGINGDHGSVAFGVTSTDTIGGTAAGAGNVISGNTGNGLTLKLDLVQGNFIGTDVTGAKPLPNGGDGFGFGTESDTIGGTAAEARNVISGNTGNGLSLQDSDLVQGNFIGTDVTGAKRLPNGGVGLAAIGGSDTIGGTTAGAGNVISGNAGDGLTIGLPQDIVQGNFIGTDLTGTRALANGGDGVSVGSPLLGGPESQPTGFIVISGNVISGNAGNGLTIGSGLDVANNSIGTDITGLGSLPNGGDGIKVLGTFNRISENSIDSNVGLGIDLGGDGVTPNNPAGSPTGPNLLQPYPVLTSAASTSTATFLSATLDAKPSTSYRIEFFSNPVADPSGYGQGKTYLGSTLVTTDTSGQASFSFASTQDLLGQSISATATDPSGNTSEFARDVTVVPLLTTTTTLIGPGPVATLGQPTTFAAVVGAAVGGVPTGLVDFLQDGAVIGSAPLNASGIAVFITKNLAPGPGIITATYAGDSTQAASQSNAVALSVFAPHAFGGPAVTSTVALAPDTVTIGFNRGLMPGPAEDAANYTIVGPGHRAIAVEAAFYNPKKARVRLTTIQDLTPGQTYQLTINGETGERVVDVFGIPLDGKGNRRPGHDYVGKFAVKKVPAVKVAHPAGPKAQARASKKGH